MKHLGYLGNCVTRYSEVNACNLLIKECGELGEVVGLPGSLVLPNHLECGLGYLDGFKDSGNGVTLIFKFYSTYPS